MAEHPELVAQIAEIVAERKLKSELMTAEEKALSLSDRLKNHTDAFASSIRAFSKAEAPHGAGNPCAKVAHRHGEPSLTGAEAAP